MGEMKANSGVTVSGSAGQEPHGGKVRPVTDLTADEPEDFGGIGFTIGTHLDTTQRPQVDAVSMDQAAPETILAQTLKSTRESLGLSLGDVSEITRVRTTYLDAFERATYDILPPRAFSVGYVRAYAQALGLDAESMAELFKRAFADAESGLKAPVGAAYEDVKPSYRRYVYLGLGLVAVVVVWNLVQWRKDLFGRPDPAAVIGNSSWSEGSPLMGGGGLRVSKKAQPPKDQEIPDIYVTPGLEQGFAALNDQKASDGQVSGPAYRKAFNLKGAIYGAGPDESAVTLQAKVATTLIERGPEGTIYSLQRLGPGEAFRVPLNTARPTLIDISDTQNIDVFYNGEYAGQLDGSQMSVAQINSRAIAQAHALDQQAQRQTRPVAAPKAVPTPPESPVDVTPASESASSSGPLPYLPQVGVHPASQAAPSDTPSPLPHP